MKMDTAILSDMDHSSFLPVEIFINIIDNIRVDSKQFLLDYLNITNAVYKHSPATESLIKYLIENFNNHVDIIDLTNPNESSPIISQLKKYFDVNFFTTQKKDKCILLINDDILNKFTNKTQFIEFFEKLFFRFNIQEYSKLLIDIVYCPSLVEPTSETQNLQNTENESVVKSDYMVREIKLDDSGEQIVPDLINFISLFPKNFVLDNLIIDFNYDKILLPKDLFGMYSSKFFISDGSNNNNANTTNNNRTSIFNESFGASMNRRTQVVNNGNNSNSNNVVKWLEPMCNQITFSSAKHLLIDYMAMDTFISHIFEVYGDESDHSTEMTTESSVSYLFGNFLTKVHFYVPDVQDFTFHNKNCPNATCNFIDLSTNILQKISENKITLKYYFDLHALKNWNMNKLVNFGGHRFKFDVTASPGLTPQYTQKISANIKLLSTMINNETKDGVTYLRVALFPPSVKNSKILNWLPLGSSETLDSTSTTGSTTSPSRTPVPNEPKPILCLKSSSLETLELRVLKIDKDKNNHIQGLFLPNLQRLILQNFQFNVNAPSSVTSNGPDNIESKGKNANDNDEDKMMINDMELYPTGFSSWNDLSNCSMINLIDNVQQSDQMESHAIHLVFNIKNLKRIMPKIKLKESFYTFVDERQQFIVV